MKIFILVLCLFLSEEAFAGNLRLGSPFTEHMVLQRDLPIQVWGEAAPGAEVEVSLNNEKVSIQSNSEVNWQATLSAQKAGGPYSFSVTSGEESLVFNDVMIGEVWICSGQSNMFMSYKQVPEIDSLRTTAKNVLRGSRVFLDFR